MLDNSSFNEDRFLRETALAATDQILQWGDVSRLKMLFLGKRLGHQLQNIRFFRLVIRKWRELGVHRHNWNFVFGLVDYVLDKMIEEKGSNDLLCIAASAGCVPFARRFISSAQGKSELRNELLREPQYEQQGPRAFRKPTHQSVGEAVLENKVDMVEFLLGEELIRAHFQHRNCRCENVLHLASNICNPNMFGLLIPAFQEVVHQTDDQGNTPLVRTIKNIQAPGNRYKSARILLLQSSTDWNTYPQHGEQDPLRVAVRLGDLEMCDLLVSTGNMDPRPALACDDEGRIVLGHNSPENVEVMPQILELLCAHADLESELTPR